MLIFFRMKKSLLALLLLLPAVGLSAQTAQVKWYGFVRNYYAFDTRESVAGVEDFFYYVPKDVNMSAAGTDLNEAPSFRFAALTSRLGVNVSGYSFNGWDMGAKIETDFYAGVSGVTGTALLRLRQAYLTFGKNALSFKIGQAWHPLAADIPDVISLNTGAPFNPFSRTPLVMMDYGISDELSLSAAAIWQMQYTSAGPEGQVANYIKYGCTPELYLGLNYHSNGLLARAGVDVLSVKPRRFSASGSRVSDRITTVSPFVYVQYNKDLLTVKAKSVYAEAGEHLNLNGGYAVSGVNSDGSYDYTPTRNLSSWMSIQYGKKWQGVFFAGYVKNFGTGKDIVSTDMLYFSKNSYSNMNSMWRITPTVVYNLGKLAFALEYELTSVQYGEWGDDYKSALATKNLHWVTNHRVQAMVKYTF